MWYRLLAPHAVQSGIEVDELRTNPTLGELRKMVKRTDALAIKVDYGLLGDPGPEDMKEIPALAWWFDLG